MSDTNRQVFGGEWTREKLDRLAKYLHAYTTIFTKNPKARFFDTVYVDAFAGAGYIQTAKAGPSQRALFAELTQQDAQGYIKGSAVRALEVEPGFDKYLFIEKSAERCKELENLKTKYPTKKEKIDIVNGNANEYLQDWCRNTDWSKTRAVVFLDPWGMEVEWSLVEEIARTQAIDLWYLFPLGIGVMRLLTSREPPPEAWGTRLTKILGPDWKQEFYLRTTEPALFGPIERQVRAADYEAVGTFFLKRLKKIFARVAPKPYVLRNSKNTPLYLFCFAAGNPKGAPTAVKIAQEIMGE